MNLRRTLQATLLTLGLLLGSFTLIGTANAGANEGWNYLVVQNRACSNGGTIQYLSGSIHDETGYPMWSGGDSGDNILYPKVRYGQYNTFIGRALCVKGSASLWTNIYRNFRPSPGQTIWL